MTRDNLCEIDVLNTYAHRQVYNVQSLTKIFVSWVMAKMSGQFGLWFGVRDKVGRPSGELGVSKSME